VRHARDTCEAQAEKSHEVEAEKRLPMSSLCIKIKIEIFLLIKKIDAWSKKIKK